METQVRNVSALSLPIDRARLVKAKLGNIAQSREDAEQKRREIRKQIIETGRKIGSLRSHERNAADKREAAQYHTQMKRLRGQHPAAFQTGKPLKVGIGLDLYRETGSTSIGTLYSIKKLLARYTRHPLYLTALLQAGVPRFDLDGNPAGVVTEEQAIHATKKLDEHRRREGELKRLRAVLERMK